MLRLFVVAALLTTAFPAMAQEIDLREIFSNDRFYRESGLLKARGDVDFVAHLWLLPGTADSSRALIGISLSNTELRFVRVQDGGWRADYAVNAEIDPGREPKILRRWDKSLELDSFDETRLSGETIVFQTELPLAPGKYHFRLTVIDRNAAESGRVDGEIEVPPPGDLALAEPVLLQEVLRQGEEPEYIVHPSHAFPTRPARIEFMVAGQAPAGSAPLTARARLVRPGPQDAIETIDGVDQAVTFAQDGSFTAFAALDPREGLGEHRIEVALVDASGAELARAETRLMIAGSATWIAEHWKDVLSLLRYEATEDELDILKKIEDPTQRIEAWTCFWRMRDPIPTTAANEAMQQYLDRIQTANQMWSSALRPGYQSDRGQVYVRLGAPSEIDTNPMPRGGQAYEVWTYFTGRQFQIVFVDRIGFNNYQLESIGTYQRELSTIDRRKRQFLRDRARLCPLLEPAFGKAD